MCRSTSGSCSVTPRVCPAGRMVTFATGSACSDRAATSAWPDSCTATACFSSGSSTFEPSLRPRMIRSRAASKSPPVTTFLLSRTAKMAASFARLARSAPEKPGVPLATTLRFTFCASVLPLVCTRRIASRSLTLGSGIVTCRSNRPGRSSAGSSTSGRLVAPSTTMPDTGSKPSISASSWLSVCSRSSLDTAAPDPARRWPIASISSMKMIAGARLRASENRSRTRDAPTPTNSSTKLDPVTEKNGTLASPATARDQRPDPGVPVRVAQEVDHLGDLGLGALVPGHVGERGGGAFLVEDLGPGPARAQHAAQLPGRALRDPPEQPDRQDNRQPEHDQVDQHLGAEALTRRGGGDRRDVVGQVGERVLPGLRRDDHGEGFAALQRAGARAADRPGDL